MTRDYIKQKAELYMKNFHNTELSETDLILFAEQLLNEQKTWHYVTDELLHKEYIRFGEIPKEEKSKRGNGIIGDGYKVVGYEEGVSVWDCVYNFDTDKYHLVAPHGNSCTHGDFSKSAFPDDCYGCDPNQKIYVVTGIEVGYGADKEPLLKDVKIVKELPYDYFAFEE